MEFLVLPGAACSYLCGSIAGTVSARLSWHLRRTVLEVDPSVTSEQLLGSEYIYPRAVFSLSLRLFTYTLTV